MRLRYLMLVPLAVACGGTQKPTQKQLDCQVEVVAELVAGNTDLIQEVFEAPTVEAKLKEVMKRLGRAAVQVEDAVQRFKECDPVFAPPPVDAGAKVL